jgi:pyruvate kinase
MNSATTDLSQVNRTKIVTTLGPASFTEETLKALILAGANVFRLNMSHCDSEEQRQRIILLRRIAEEMDRPMAILADLQGPKVRTGEVKDGHPVPLEAESLVELTCRTIVSSPATSSSPAIVATTCEELLTVLEAGSLVLLDDGKIHLQVTERLDAQTVRCRVTQSGLLDARKGINIPGSTLPIAALTDKDKEDLAMAARAEVDYVALSFVQRAEDIRELRNLVAELGCECPRVIAKIEKPQALQDIDAILAEADGLMVARGDLGVELPPEAVPVAQKMLVSKANQAEKPVIIATQMLESMISSLQPSRSDVSDIANAVFEGADLLMLSGETSVGAHPVETVMMMSRIIRETEKNIFSNTDRPAEESRIVSPNFYHAIAHTASYGCRKANVKALVVFSGSGNMAQRISKLKPARPIIALTPSRAVYNQMSLLWGVTPLLIAPFEDTDEMLENVDRAIMDKGLLQHSDSILFCAGATQMKGATNMLKIYSLGCPD